VPHQQDAWDTFLDYAQRFFESLDALPEERAAELCPPGGSGCGSSEGPPEAVSLLMGEPLELARLLGRRTAEMHAALADPAASPAFAPEPFSLVYQRGLRQSMRNTTRMSLDTLRKRLESLEGPVRAAAETLLAREADLMAMFRELTIRPIRTPRIRVHGDYHLGQVLWTGKDFIIIDFEGEPMRSVGERRLKRSPMKDVAGMVRSFDYAAWTGLRRHWELLPPAEARPSPRERDELGARIWGGWLAHEFVRQYMSSLRQLRPELLPATQEDAELVLRSWVLEKALYEISYELNSRPDWVDIPLRAVMNVIGS
jgi:maltose alpha-D-glucosyltransferase/alpha-amylase